MNIIYISIFLVIFFFLLVFNEVIELNCFKLEKNTIKNLQKRAVSESILEIYDGSDDESSSSDEKNNESIDMKNLKMNEKEEIEEKDLKNIEQKTFIYPSSMRKSKRL